MTQDWQFHIEKEDNNRTLRNVLKERLLFSKKWLATCKANSWVRLNGHIGYYNKIVHTGDFVEVIFDLHETTSVKAIPMDLDILFENEDYLVVNKPPGMPTHPVGIHQIDTLGNGVIDYFLNHGLHRKFRPAGRLDANTSGILVVCKHPLAQAAFTKMAAGQQIKKQYLAICEGHLPEHKGDIIAPIGPSDTFPIRIICPEGKYCHTGYKVIRRTPQHSLLLVTLFTGRTHQIRVHLAHIGHPLVGDVLYGANQGSLDRHALHAARLSFPDPRQPNKIIHIHSALPEALRNLLTKTG